MVAISWTIGRCIYCGSTGNLSDEHIIPYGLGGRWVLRKASCKECADITSRFELNVLRNLWGPARAAFGLPTRRRYINKYPLTIERNGAKEITEIDPAECGVPLLFTHFEAPAYLSGKPFSKGIAMNGQTTHILPSTEYFKNAIKAKFNPDRIEFTATYKPYSPTDFAKMLAKIAYGFAVAQNGLDGIKTPYVLDALLNKKDDIGMWVGCNADAKEFSTGVDDFEIRLNFINSPKRDIVVEIKLFGKLETPTYLVVVGEPTAEKLKGVHFDQDVVSTIYMTK